MSRSLERRGWAALIAASALSTIAFVAVPRGERGVEPQQPDEPALEPEAADESGTVLPGGARRQRLAANARKGEIAEPAFSEPAVLARRAPAKFTRLADPDAAVRAALSRPEPGVDAVTLADRLVAIGPGALPGILRSLLEPGAPEEVSDARAAELEPLRREALRDAWARFEPGARIAALRAAFEAAEPDRLRLLAGLAGETADGEAVRLLLDLAGRLDEIHLQRPYVTEPIEAALVRTLPIALESSATARSLRELRGPLAQIAGRAALLSRTRIGASAAVAMLGREPALDGALLATLARKDLAVRSLLCDSELRILRLRTTAREPDVRRAACAVLGNARDTGALEELVACLDDVDALVAAAARASLRATTGKDRGMTSDAWASWLDEREVWLAGEAAKLVDLARGADPDAGVAALDRLLERVDAHHEWVELLGELLDSDCPKVVRRAASGLRCIGTGEALLRLERAIGDASGARLRMLEEPEG